MKQKKFSPLPLLCFILLVVFILDSKTCAAGAEDGLSLCFKTVIPALFPMMVLTSIVSQSHMIKLPFLSHMLGIPKGAESIFVSGALGGYPVGAKCVAEAYLSKNLSKGEAEHMLHFCNNAGPSFIFGICGVFFTSSYIPLLLWAVQIISAIISAIVFTDKPIEKSIQGKEKHLDLTDALANSVKAMGLICGWIILFRVLLTFLQKWVLWVLPEHFQILAFGVLEITNGCCMLAQQSSETIRFVLCSVMLSFGGLCVAAQTRAVIAPLPMGAYIKGKLLQTALSFLLSEAVSLTFHVPQINARETITICCALFAIVLLLCHAKKVIAFSGNVMYNKQKLCKKR